VVQIDLPAAVAVSMLFLDAGRKVILAGHAKGEAEQRAVYYKFLFRSVFFAGAVVAPAGIYLLAGWPGWEQIYWSRRVEHVIHSGWLNPLLYALFVLAIVVAGYLGHVIGFRWLTGGRAKFLRPTYIGLLIIVGVIVLLNYPAFLLVGTYDQYHNLGGLSRAAMPSVWSNPHDFSAAWIGVMIYFIVTLGIALLVIRREAGSHGENRS
jgi:hypothetical protein